MRVTAGMIVEALSAGRTAEQLLGDFPYLEEADIREALVVARAKPSQNVQSLQWDTGGVPTVLLTGPYRFYFFSHEPNEPPHVHVDRDDQSAKFWLEPVALARNLGFSPPELRRISRLVAENHDQIMERWREHFDD
jgi:hypothetical protein